VLQLFNAVMAAGRYNFSSRDWTFYNFLPMTAVNDVHFISYTLPTCN